MNGAFAPFIFFSFFRAAPGPFDGKRNEYKILSTAGAFVCHFIPGKALVAFAIEHRQTNTAALNNCVGIFCQSLAEKKEDTCGNYSVHKKRLQSLQMHSNLASPFFERRSETIFST